MNDMRVPASPRRAALAALAIVLPALALGCGDGRKSLGVSVVSHTVTTDDDWTLHLRRYTTDRPEPGRLPVVLCHGLSYNGTFWDLRADVSLAQYLAARGYDVWVPSLRGAGSSTKPGYSRLRQLFRLDFAGGVGGALTSKGKGLLKWNWTVDDHAAADVPAILDAVTAASGAPAVHWVGHSMGGMVMVAHLAGRDGGTDPRVRSFVAAAVPVTIVKPLSEPMKLLAEARGPIELSNAAISTSLPALLGMLAGKAIQTPLDILFYNSANLDDDLIRRLNAFATEDISPGQFAQLLDMISGGRFVSQDGRTDYAASVEAMATPTFWLAGTVDNLATVAAVKDAYNRCPAPRKQFRLFGRVNGESVDFGHDDLMISPNAHTEVFPAACFCEQKHGTQLDSFEGEADK